MLMGHRPRAAREASVAVGIARLPIVAVGHAIAVPVATGMASASAIGCRVVAVGNTVAITVPIPMVGYTVAVTVRVGAVGHGAAIGRRVVAGGDAVMVAIPAARLHVPPAAAFHPLGRTVAVAGACLDPIAFYPHMMVAAPLPVAGHPDHVASGGAALPRSAVAAGPSG